MIEATKADLATALGLGNGQQIERYCEAMSARWGEMFNTIRSFNRTNALNIASGVIQSELDKVQAAHTAVFVTHYDGTAGGGTGPPNLDDFAPEPEQEPEGGE